MSAKVNAGLVQLPPELVKIIASHLATTDICALRLACKRMKHLLYEFFIRKYFRAKQFWIHEASLQTLINIAEDPAISPELEYVALATDHFKLFPRRAVIKEVTDDINAQRVLLGTGSDIVMLTQAFAKLPNMNTISIRDFDKEPISIIDFEKELVTYSRHWHSFPLPEDTKRFDSHGATEERRANGLSTRRARYDEEGGHFNNSTPSQIFNDTLIALANASARPKALEAVFAECGWSLVDPAFYVPDPLQPSLQQALLRLTRLSLDLNLGWNRMAPVGRRPFNYSPFLYKFLSLTQQLCRLRLRITSEDSGPIEELFRWLAHALGPMPDVLQSLFPPPVNFIHLEHLEIGDTELRRNTLNVLVAKLSPTLRKLSLSRVMLRYARQQDPGEIRSLWSKFLTSLAAHPRTDLQSFHLFQPFVYAPLRMLRGRVEVDRSKQLTMAYDMKLFLKNLAESIRDQFDIINNKDVSCWPDASKGFDVHYVIREDRVCHAGWTFED